MTKTRKIIFTLLMVLILAGIPSAVFADEGISDGEQTTEVFSVNMLETEWNYTGDNVMPGITVTAENCDEPLVENTDYTVSYTNNLYPGTATVTVEGIGKYAGTDPVEKEFKIKLAGVKGVILSKRYTTSLKLSWNRADVADGYKIYQKKSGVWTCIDEVADSSQNNYTVKGLNSATGYYFAVKAYVVDSENKVYLSELSDGLSTFTKPEATKITGKTALVCALKAEWEKKKCTGYEVVASRYSDFRTTARKKTVSSKYGYAYLYDLKKEQKYYVRVRPYYVKNGKKVYGNWSSYRTVTTKPISAGWNTIKGHKYYYSKGYALKGNHYIGGDPYYFDSTGKLRGSSYNMWKKAKNASSSTNWLMVTDTYTNATCVYYRSGGEWKVKRYIRCSTGAYDTPTIKGNFYVCSKGYSFSDEDYTCWYWTGFYGSEYLYHSVPYVTGSKTYYRDSRIGLNISHGCVRMKINHAKWVYDNIPYYSKVITF